MSASLLDQVSPLAIERKRPPQWRRIASGIFRVRLTSFGVVLILGVIFIAIFANVLAPDDPNIGDFSNVLAPPSFNHLLGTDELGRDILTRILYGSRISLVVGFGSTALSAAVGVIFGILGGYYGGWIDELLMRITDALLAFPSLILALAIAAALEPGVASIILAIAATSFSTMARLARASTLVIKETEFIEAARSIGATDRRLLFIHLMPNTLSAVVVQFALTISHAILAEAALSFLGVGVPPPQASWGSMLKAGYQYLEVAPWVSIFPGVAIFLTVIGFNLLGDGLRVALDPRLRDAGHA